MTFNFNNSGIPKEELKKRVCEANLKAYSGNSASEFGELQDATTHYLEFVNKNVQNLLNGIGRDNLKIIEVGCGSGLMTRYFFKYTKNSKIYCQDLSKDILAVLKNKLSKEDIKRAKFISGDATDYFKETKEKFDIISVHGSLHHMVDYLDLIKIASTKLNKGGIFYIANEPLPRKFYNFYLTELLANWDIAFYHYLGKNNIKFILQLGFAPIHFIKPILNSKLIKPFKDKILHGRYLGEVDWAEYWRIDEKGLDLKGIHSIFKENNIKVKKFESFSYHRTIFLYKLGKHFSVNRFFNLVGIKN
jgi:ubiquinone/menaquinone biosynthesis C-methylase UbiE